MRKFAHLRICASVAVSKVASLRVSRPQRRRILKYRMTDMAHMVL
jgi:hypothetical protein